MKDTKITTEFVRKTKNEHISNLLRKWVDHPVFEDLSDDLDLDELATVLAIIQTIFVIDRDNFMLAVTQSHVIARALAEGAVECRQKQGEKKT